MAAWYRELDLLPGGIERIVPAASSLEATVSQIMSETGLAGPGESHSEAVWPAAPMQGAGSVVTRLSG